MIVDILNDNYRLFIDIYKLNSLDSKGYISEVVRY